MIASVDPGPHLYWLSSRAAGTAALVLASLAVFVGALRAGGLAGAGVRGSRRRLEIAIVHEMLGLAVVVTIVIHGLVLMGDNFLSWSFADIAIPGSSSYETGPTAIGIVSGYVFMVLSLTYYVRDRIGDDTWMLLHRFVLLAWVGSFIHTFGMGTDKDKAWYLAVLLLPAVGALAALVMRLVGVGRAGRPAPQSTA